MGILTRFVRILILNNYDFELSFKSYFNILNIPQFFSCFTTQGQYYTLKVKVGVNTIWIDQISKRIESNRTYYLFES